MTATAPEIRAVLFDLDGTLVDSAPDLAGTANDMRLKRGLEPLGYQELRVTAGSGARGMLGMAFGIAPGHSRYEPLRDEFHDLYEQRMLRETRLFAAVEPVLQGLEQRGVAWGIVTNKALRFAKPLASALGLWPRTQVLVAGDTTPHTKPHPAPLLEAASQLGVPAGCCTYVGDDLRDMRAARAAGMGAIAAAWGYLGVGGMPNDWGADLVLDELGALLQFLNLT